MSNGDKFQCPLYGQAAHPSCAKGKDSRALLCGPCTVDVRRLLRNGQSGPTSAQTAAYVEQLTGAAPVVVGRPTPKQAPAPHPVAAPPPHGVDLSNLTREVERLTQQAAQRKQPTPVPVAVAQPDGLQQLADQIKRLAAMMEDDRKPENEIWRAASTLANFKQRNAPADHLDLEQADDLPVGLACLPDAHIGGGGTAYNVMLRDAALISRTPGMIAMIPGDTMNNFITPGKLASAARADILQPDLQWFLVRDWIKRLKPARTVVFPGNHEIWTAAMANVMPLRDIAEDLEAAYVHGHVARIVVKFPSGVQYDIAFAHGFRMHSNMNLTHRAKQLIRYEAMWADIAIVGDRHEAAWEHCRLSGLDRIAVACDTYKVMDQFSQSLGYAPARAIVPVIILSSDKKKMVVLPDLESGAAYLTYLRGGK